MMFTCFGDNDISLLEELTHPRPKPELGDRLIVFIRDGKSELGDFDLLRVLLEWLETLSKFWE